MINSRTTLAGAGSTQNVTLAFGGNIASTLSCTETYNGSNWSSTTSMLNVVTGHANAGNRSDALSSGGAAALCAVEAFTAPSCIRLC